MSKKYEYLEQLDCFDKLKEKVPHMLDDLEEQMRWYEEDATDEDIGECGEKLSRFLVAVYGAGESVEEWLEDISEEIQFSSFKCNEDLKQYTDSMLFDSGEVIATMIYQGKGHKIEITLEVRGEVKVDYKGERYRYPSEFSEELKELIKNNPNAWDLIDGVYVDMNNWFEYIYDDTVNGSTYSDGVMFERDLSVCTADEIKAEMLEIAKEIAEGE